MISQTVLTKLQWIAEQAVRESGFVFRSLAHQMDVEFLAEAYRRTSKDSAPGVDKVTAREYAKNLAGNLRDLHERLRSQRYRAQPVERVWIDKEDGKKRPIGKGCFEDKIVQRAVVMLMGAVYEQDFHDFSYGFREGRNPHQVLTELRKQCMGMNINWIVDADVTGFFDNIERGLLREMICKRINDGSIIRLIGKWLNAGVIDGRSLSYPEKGAPQGAVISPMLANIFLHHVLDEWFVKEAKPRMKGRCLIIRFADDFVIGCELEEDARRIMEELPKRFARFKLTIHPEKTAMIKFSKPGKEDFGKGNGTFDFLGFNHYWAKSRRGYWVIKRKTARRKMQRAMKRMWQWCKYNRHVNIKEQYKMLCSKLRGHYQYYGIRCNYKAMEMVFEYTEKAWRCWLNRRGGDKNISWDKFDRMRNFLQLPKPRIIHSI